MLLAGTFYKVKIPIQYSDEIYAVIRNFEAQVGKPILVLTVGQLIASLFLGAGLKYLWNQIYIVQFIVFFLNWKINIPARAMVLLEILKDLVFFEFVKDMLAYVTDDEVEC